MAKKKISVSIKGLLDLDARTVTEYDKKTEVETVHSLDNLLLPFNSLGDVSISIAYDSEIEAE